MSSGRLRRVLRMGGIAIAGIFVVLALAFLVLTRKYMMPSSSMEPTLHCARPQPGCEARSSDRLLVLRFGAFHGPQRGDIFVFKTPPQAVERCGAGGTFVKRLIGLPGDVLKERNGFVFIDGVKLEETYVKPDERDNQNFGPATIPPGHYFMMGDNRAASCDSRVWGSVPRKNLIGEVFMIYWPPQRWSFR